MLFLAYQQKAMSMVYQTGDPKLGLSFSWLTRVSSIYCLMDISWKLQNTLIFGLLIFISCGIIFYVFPKDGVNIGFEQKIFLSYFYD